MSELAKLPPGVSGVFTGINENFAFHASPENFIATRVGKYHRDNPEKASDRTCVRATMLNRNVAIVSAYRQVKEILEDDSGQNSDDKNQPRFVATAPYKRLMEDFFPPPNLLLVDGCPHAQRKARWAADAQPLVTPNVQKGMESITTQFITRLTELGGSQPVDLYATLKDLAWRLFLFVFLDLSPSSSSAFSEQEYKTYVELQETLLRGQFSLLPVSINVGFWQSPRKTGIDARKKLQMLIRKQLERKTPTWLESSCHLGEEMEEMINHILMSTSSLAVKAFASSLMAVLLNLYGKQNTRGHNSPAESLHGGLSANEVRARREAIVMETLRLSPPIVGVMRRTTRDSVLPSHKTKSWLSAAGNEKESDVLIPAGWDVWTYFPGANRDPTVFPSADCFDALRYVHDKATPNTQVPPPIVFGAGPKRCLGADFVQSGIMSVLAAFSNAHVAMDVSVEAPGVRGWLGWQEATPDEWAADMKQLPTQRPAKSIMCTFRTWSAN